MAQESPTVQLLDTPEFPLKKNKISKLKYGALGFFGGFILMGLIIFYTIQVRKQTFFWRQFYFCIVLLHKVGLFFQMNPYKFHWD